MANNKLNGTWEDMKTNGKNNTDTIQFIEEILDIKLLDYQKRIIKEIAEHPEYKSVNMCKNGGQKWQITN